MRRLLRGLSFGSFATNFLMCLEFGLNVCDYFSTVYTIKLFVTGLLSLFFKQHYGMMRDLAISVAAISQKPK